MRFKGNNDLLVKCPEVFLLPLHPLDIRVGLLQSSFQSLILFFGRCGFRFHGDGCIATHLCRRTKLKARLQAVDFEAKGFLGEKSVNMINMWRIRDQLRAI